MIEKLQGKLWTQYNDKKKGDHAVSKLNDFVYNLNEATRYAKLTYWRKFSLYSLNFL